MPQTPGADGQQAEPASLDGHAEQIERLNRLLGRQMREIEDRMTPGSGDGTAADFERQARTLASMIRALERLIELKRSSAPPTPEGTDREQDADRFRLEIAQRLDRMRADGQG